MEEHKPAYRGSLPDEGINVTEENPLSLALKLTISLALIVVIGYFALHLIINKAVDAVTPEQEKQIQKLFAHDGKVAETNSTKLKNVLAKLTKCADLPYPIVLQVSETDEINAFAVPGGYIYLTKGILGKMTTENELAFVLGHELGHFKHKDYLRSMGFKLTMAVVAQMLGTNYGSAASIPLNISSAKYSQEEEFAADEFGLEMMNCAYGTVNGAIQMFEKMDDGQEWRHFVATHPGFKERIKTMKKISAEKGYDSSKKMVPLVKLEVRN